MANRKVIFDIESRDKSGKGIQSSENALKKLDKTLMSMMTSGLGAAAAVAAVGVAAKKAIENASNLEETTSKVNVVFGEARESVLAFGKTAADSLGMSENAALTAAATYGNLFRAMGVAEEKSAEMSINLVKLAGDLASFNNLDPTEVFEKLRAGLTGEAEPLKTLGVNINETVIKMKAMELGLSDGKSVLDASTKATAAYALILEQTALAQGDFARTSEGLANQQRILKANWEDLSAAAGQKLLPPVTDLVILFNDLTNSEKNLTTVAAEYINKVAEGTWAESSYSKELRAKNEALAESERLFQEGIAVAAANAGVGVEFMATKMGHLGIEVDDVNDSIGGSGGLASNVKKATNYFDELTARMIYNHLAANMDADAAMKLAIQMGLINYETYNTLSALDQLTAKYDASGNGAIEAAEMTKEYVAELDKILGLQNSIKDKHVRFTLETKYTSTGSPSGYESGGGMTEQVNAAGNTGFTVPPHFNHDNFMIGVKSGERVEVTPASRVGSSDKGSGGGGNTYVFNATGITDPDQFLKYVGQKVKQQGGL